MERQLNFVNNLNNRVRKRYYIDDNSEFDLVPQEENNQVYSINDNQLFQMEVANEEEEISGNIVSFMGRQKTKIEKLQVSIQPMQDLNGYDNPWPAGGGKNKFDKEVITSITSNGIEYQVQLSPNTQYTMSTSHPVSQSTAAFVFFKLSGESDRTAGNGVWLNHPHTITTGADGIAIVKCRTLDRETLATFLTYNYQIESGSTATSYAPYSNICPITGFDSVTVNRTGKNLLKYPYKNPSGTVGNINITVNQDGTLTYSGTDPSIRWFSFYGGNSTTVSQLSSLADLGLNGGDTVTITNESTGRFVLQFNKADGTLTWPSSIYKDGIGSTTGTIPYDAVYAYIGLRFSANTAYSAENVGFQIELGSTATAYEPYQGNEYTIQLGETVYGGTLDVVNGKMTVDRTIIDCASITTWSIDKNAKRIYKIMSELAPASGGGVVVDGLICNRFKSISVHQIYANIEGVAISTGSALQFRINGLTDNPDVTLADVNSYFTANETKVVAKLATPIEIPLPPEQISTLQGTNNVWSDIGLITLKYSTKGLTTYLLKP